MEQFITRIVVKHEEGARILYCSDKTALKNFGQPIGTDILKSTPFSKGSIINIDDKEYEIVDIYTRLYNEFIPDDDGKGVNIYGQGERLGFNMDINYIVK